MTATHAVIIVAVGFVAGTVNTIVGSGSLLTFPTLLGLGYPAVLANVSNTVGLISGSVSGAVGYRRELKGQLRRILVLMPAVLVGTIAGASLLLALPGSAFRKVVPILILFAVVLVIVQPTVARRRAERGARAEHPTTELHIGTALISVYGGYFGAAQGVMLLALFGITLDDDMQRLNAAKNVVAAVINAVGAVFFIASTDIAWKVAGLLFIGSTFGGQLGAHIGRRLPAEILRAAIVLVGTGVAIKLLVTG
ncbi:MAG TPA: sulfite exporter TauE/SafE family protein [Mycobacteriales bacterium]|nr:sulfite exporter TauE/SafE family protein [Mycobacteriales bacterium]HVU62041.1 sulfite exporter TauE/SafE family protein [Mycobacteriales bacterium]